MSSDGVCHRTHVAVRTQTLSYWDWKRFVDGDESVADDLVKEAKAASFISERLLVPYHQTAMCAKRILDTEEMQNCGLSPSTLSTIRRRWSQIESLVGVLLGNALKETVCKEGETNA